MEFMEFKCYIKPPLSPVFVLQAEDKHWEQVCHIKHIEIIEITLT